MYFSDPEYNIQQLGPKEGDEVADLGAGSGAHTFVLAEAVGLPGAVYAVDIQKDILKELSTRATKEGYTNIAPLVADIEREKGIELDDSSLDSAVASNVLFQTDDRPAFLKEAFRILKPEGRLLVIDWSESFRGMGPPPENVVSAEEVKNIATEVGFKFEKEISAGAHHYGLIFIKK
ncbi:MAG: methyltransferase domain-containing protein [Candidatus Campbellbacteria bacterium]|nr:methyltransferase domain-containing protein [Candidatus Campbellbacteria bacterium]